MRIPRIFQNTPFPIHGQIELDLDASRHLKNVLRLEKEDKVILFNGDGNEYLSAITLITKHTVFLKILEVTEKNCESSLKIHLGQVISKGEKMDFVIQKATELGVHSITPLFSERSVVHLPKDRMEKKIEHWQKIAIHASEQCGRTIVPKIEKPLPLFEWVHERPEKTRLVLSLSTDNTLSKLSFHDSVALLIGPEGGLTSEEVEYAKARNFTAIKLGPRVLRTETAALAIITAVQLQGGDLNSI